MIKTLQLYISRELLKTFVLTAVGLTLTFSLCGGVLNMIEAEVLTAVELARFLGFILPVATTLTLPVSALFACAMVYGRFAADNELDACKASGINIHRLLAPAVGLSVVTAAFTFSFSNYVIPKFIEQLEIMVRKDIQKIAIGALARQGYLRYGGYVLHAGKSNLYNRDDQRDVMIIQDAAFLELEGEHLARCGTAREAVIDFWASPDSETPLVEAVMRDIRGVDVLHYQYFQEQERPFVSIQIPRRFEQEPKWLTLPKLYYYREHPTELLPIQEAINKLRLLVRYNLFYRDVWETLSEPGGTITLKESDRYGYEIRADRARLDPEDYLPELTDVVVKHAWFDEEGNARLRIYKAAECLLKVEPRYGDEADRVSVNLKGGVTFTDRIDPDNQIERNRIELPDVPLPPQYARQEGELFAPEKLKSMLGLDLVFERGVTGEEELQKKLPELDLGLEVRGTRLSILQDIIEQKLEIDGIVHSRFAFSVSALVTLLLAATLGIIYRGGHLLTAFVISFIPGLLVVVANIMGRQLVEEPPTHLLGITIIWAAIVLLGIADIVILFRYLRR